MEVILASQSPRRKELMELLKIPFTVCSADVDETMDPTRPVMEEVARISCRKANAVPRKPEDIVIAADTVVVCQGQVLGKPADRQDARRMLQLLSGRKHQVMTGLTVCKGSRQVVCTEVTEICFRQLSPKEISDYIATDEPMDKAGAYAIQGGGALFAEKLVGDYYNVVGLPVCRLGQILKEFTEESQ